MGFLEEFTAFLEEYRVVGLAIAFVIGLAVTDLVDAAVEDLIMPVVEALLPHGNWQTYVLNVAGVDFRLGHFLAALVDFVVVALLVYLFVRYVLRKQEIGKI